MDRAASSSRGADPWGAELRAPVFVVGCPRSGTTLLQVLLGAHPEVYIGGETHYVQRFVRSPGRRDLSQDSQWNQLLADVTAVPEFEESGASVDAFLELCETGRRDLRTPLAAWLTASARAHGASTVGEKTPNHLFDVPLLAEWFPDARFIAIVRDPRGTVLSTRDVWWSAGSYRRDARAWRRYHEALDRARPRLDAVVKYEELAADPESSIRALEQVLGVPHHEATAGHLGGPVDGVNLEREPWKDAVARPVDSARTERWRTELTARDIRDIEQVAWRGMRAESYRTDTPMRDLVAGHLVEEGLRHGRRWTSALKAVRS